MTRLPGAFSEGSMRYGGVRTVVGVGQERCVRNRCFGIRGCQNLALFGGKLPMIVEAFDRKPPVLRSLHVQLTDIPGLVPPPLPRLLLVISRRISVVRLLFRRSPAKIADLVVPISIDPIQRSAGGAGS